MLTKISNANDKTLLGEDFARPFDAVSTESLLAVAALQPRGEDDKTPVVFQDISMSPPVASEPEQLAALLSPRAAAATLGAPPSKAQVARAGKKARRGWRLVVGAAGVGVAVGLGAIFAPSWLPDGWTTGGTATLAFFLSAVALSLHTVGHTVSVSGVCGDIFWPRVAKPLSRKKKAALAQILAAHPQGEKYRAQLLPIEREPVGLDIIIADCALQNWVQEQADAARQRALAQQGPKKPFWKNITLW